MKCRSCGTEIAEKAIVCFRCGTPTDLPAAPVRGRPPRRRALPAWVAALAVLVIILLAVWLLALTPEGSMARGGGWTAVVVLTALVVWLRRRT
jgi:hypothetical protein